MVAEDIRTALGGERRFAASDRQGGPLYALAPEVSDRELDQFGLYSSSLEAAKRIPQEKGTVEQMRAMLLTAGAAPKELEAVGFDKAFPRSAGEGFQGGNRGVPARQPGDVGQQGKDVQLVAAGRGRGCRTVGARRMAARGGNPP